MKSKTTRKQKQIDGIMRKQQEAVHTDQQQQHQQHHRAKRKEKEKRTIHLPPLSKNRKIIPMGVQSTAQIKAALQRQLEEVKGKN